MWHAWGTGEVYTEFWSGDLWEIDHLEDLGVDGRIILKRFFRKWDEYGMGWIDLAEDRDRCRALVIAGLNLPVP